MTAADQLRRRAAALIDLGRPAEAVQILGQALATHSADADLWLTLAGAELDRDRVREALHASRQAVALAPDREEGHRVASHVLSQPGWHDDSVRAAREAVRWSRMTGRPMPRLAEALADARNWESGAMPLAVRCSRRYSSGWCSALS